MTTPDCPICERPIEKSRQVGPITFELDPCGHQIDEEVYIDLYEGE